MKPIANFKKRLQEHKNSANPVIAGGIGLMYASRDLARAGRLFFTDAQQRSIVLLRVVKPRKIHQTTTLTKLDRYPGIFSACREYFGDRNDLRILSYGCSTGEEVVSLRRYFPAAFILGAEINPGALAVCRKREVDERIEFIQSDHEVIQRHGPFDAIFCMAVLQRTPHKVIDEGITDIKKIYPFEKFNRQIKEFDGWLKANGLLVIHHTQYIVGETSIAPRYESLNSAIQEIDTGLRFNRESLRVENPNMKDSIFIKKCD